MSNGTGAWLGSASHSSRTPKFVGGPSLHTPRRIEALVHVVVMAYLVFSIFERMSGAPGPGRRQTKAPLPGKK